MPNARKIPEDYYTWPASKCWEIDGKTEGERHEEDARTNGLKIAADLLDVNTGTDKYECHEACKNQELDAGEDRCGAETGLKVEEEEVNGGHVAEDVGDVDDLGSDARAVGKDAKGDEWGLGKLVLDERGQRLG